MGRYFQDIKQVLQNILHKDKGRYKFQTTFSDYPVEVHVACAVRSPAVVPSRTLRHSSCTAPVPVHRGHSAIQHQRNNTCFDIEDKLNQKQCT